MRLLIVDDHPLNLKLLRAQLEAEGHDVIEARHGIEALAALKAEHVDAVISDILMPQMDGFRLCLELRKSESTTHLPFILYTSTYSAAEDRQLAQLVGVDRYVVKPAPARAIFDALEASIRARQNPSVPPPQAMPDEVFVLKQYSEALVEKLETKNGELDAALRRLQGAHDEILELNRDLERRVNARTSELAAANRELESFAYSVSHDLRAPLRAIGGYADMLAQDFGPRLPAEAGSLLERIGANVRRMNSLIEDLLEYSRLGRKALNIRNVDMAHLARECLDALREEISRRPDTRIAIDALPSCRGDAILLKQAILNLVSNALKYTTTTDQARIRISAEHGAGRYVFRIEDNGVGFDMRYAGKLFEVFQRLHPASEFPGTGVGLAIVRRAVERHGGRCWAQAEPGRGATFHFELPEDPLDE